MNEDIDSWENYAKQEPILCYVEDNWAHFTTQPLEKQWGDDWNDAPYEYNAGPPYSDHFGDSWKIIKVAFEGPFDTPATISTGAVTHSPYCVKEINAHPDKIPWLQVAPWSGDKNIKIPAGTTLSRFIELVEEAGGSVYLKHKQARK